MIPTIEISFYDLKIGDLILFKDFSLPKVLGKIVSTNGDIHIVNVYTSWHDNPNIYHVSIIDYVSKLDLSQECLSFLSKLGMSAWVELAIAGFCMAEKVYGLRKQDPISSYAIAALKGDAQAVDLITDTLRL